MRIDSLDHVALAVPDQEASIAWYRDVLGLERLHEEAWGAGPAVLGAPDGTGVALFRTTERRRSGFLHLAFRVSAEAYAEVRLRLAGAGIAFDEQDHTVARSIYFFDLNGIRVELTTYDLPEPG